MLDVDLHHSGKRRPQPTTTEGDEMSYEKFHDALAESVSATDEDARKFLESEGKDVDAIVSRGKKLIESLQKNRPTSGIPLEKLPE